MKKANNESIHVTYCSDAASMQDNASGLLIIVYDKSLAPQILYIHLKSDPNSQQFHTQKYSHYIESLACLSNCKALIVSTPRPDIKNFATFKYFQKQSKIVVELLSKHFSTSKDRK